MDLRQQRMECLKIAFELRGNTDPIVSAAQQLFEFVTGTQASQSTEVAAAPATNAEAPTEEQVAVTPPETPVEAPSAEAIAACGTALVLPESGELADAVPVPQPEQQAQSQPEGGTEVEAAAPTEVASEPEAHASDPQATSEAAAPQTDPIKEDQELAASKPDVEQTTEPAPETQSEAEPPTSSETEAKPAEEAMLASASANSSEPV